MVDNFADAFPYTYPIKGTFIVANIIKDSNKTIRIFDYPIPVGTTRDLLRIPGVSEASIRASLLKGELRNKLLAKEIRVITSDVDLLQFNEEQKSWLKASGVTKGLEVGSENITNELNIRIDEGGSGGGGGSTFAFAFKQNMPVTGVLNGQNRLFTVPDKFINGDVSGNTFKIKVSHNGRLLSENIDYVVQESVPAMGYDTVFFLSFVPIPSSQILVDYVVENNDMLPGDTITTRELITFIEEGPAEGFASGAYKEILPSGDPFPTSVIWWDSIAKTNKIVEANYTYNSDNLVIVEEWSSYSATGSIVTTIVDTITYDGAIEISRLRTIS